MKNKNILPIVMACIFGLLCAIWRDIFAGETTEAIAGASFVISVMSLLCTLFFTIENALELRGNSRKKLFGDYCARFSNDHSINNVAEWLFAVSIVDSYGKIEKNPKILSIDKRHTEPTPFEKERFWDFLVELNIQIKNKQIVKEDARKMFFKYAKMFDKVVIQAEEQTSCNRIRSDIEELLLE